MKNTMKTPRFFYKDVQANLIEIQQDANNLNSPREAMTNFINRYVHKLPSDITVDSVIESIVSTSYEFCNAEGHVTEADCRKELETAIAGMDEDKAYAYLATLSAMMTVCNANAVPGKNIQVPSPEELKAEIARTLECSGDKSVAEHIDELVAEISGNNMNAFVYAEGNKAVIEALNDEEFVSENCGSAVADVMENAFTKADNYAMLACACYGQILDGRIEGVTAENADPHVVAALVSAGASKGSILKRLARCEIDKEFAMDLLAKVEIALKWVLTKFMQFSVGYVTFAFILFLIGVFGFTGAFASFLVSMGIIIAIGSAIDSKEDAQEIIDLLAWLVKGAIALPFKVGKKIASMIKEKRTVSTAIPTQA